MSSRALEILADWCVSETRLLWRCSSETASRTARRSRTEVVVAVVVVMVVVVVEASLVLLLQMLPKTTVSPSSERVVMDGGPMSSVNMRWAIAAESDVPDAMGISVE